MTTQITDHRTALLRRAWWLAVFTVIWNLAEGAVEITAAALADSRALIGFGVDSSVESASATVLIWRLSVEHRSPERTEQRALRIIGVTVLASAGTTRTLAARGHRLTSLWRVPLLPGCGAAYELNRNRSSATSTPSLWCGR
jgi:hypothetical protein